MTAVYIRWRDASYGNDERDISDLGGTVELHEVGFLVREDDETVTLSMEHQDEATTTRLWMVIPKVNIVEIRTLDVAKAKRRKSV